MQLDNFGIPNPFYNILFIFNIILKLFSYCYVIIIIYNILFHLAKMLKNFMFSFSSFSAGIVMKSSIRATCWGGTAFVFVIILCQLLSYRKELSNHSWQHSHILRGLLTQVDFVERGGINVTIAFIKGLE